jgi:hypothetical protein
MPVEVRMAVRRVAGEGPPDEQKLRLAQAVGDIDHGALDDQLWFKRHYGRNHRIRKPIGVSEHLLAPRVDGAKPIVLVKQLEPGNRCRGFGAVPRGQQWPLNSEATAARLFANLIAGANVTFLDRSGG